MINIMLKNNKVNKVRAPQVRIYPYKQGSASAKKLAEALNGKVLKLVGSKFVPRLGDLIVNWGAGNYPDFAPATSLNANVSDAGCKLASFKRLQAAGVRIPDFVAAGQDRLNGRSVKEAAGASLGFPIVCRTKLRGHSGDGIVIANKPDELVEAPLYTQYVKKKDEYRVHVLRGNAFFIQRKARKLDVEDPNWQVRNLAGGFCFVEVQVEEVPQDVINQAIASIPALGLDFGGVDVMWNEKEKQAYVLEVNTACGLEDRTAEKYREEFRNLVEVQG
jgi:glutathione synthase/RimK-type ligase-like ATP-grasp enzyme